MYNLSRCHYEGSSESSFYSLQSHKGQRQYPPLEPFNRKSFFLLLHIFFPSTSCSRSFVPADRWTSKELLLIVFRLCSCHSLGHDWFNLIWIFTSTTLNQLEEKGVRTLQTRNENETRIYYRFDVSLSRDLSLFFPQSQPQKVLVLLLLEQIEMPIRETHREVNIYFTALVRLHSSSVIRLQGYLCR